MRQEVHCCFAQMDRSLALPKIRARVLLQQFQTAWREAEFLKLDQALAAPELQVGWASRGLVGAEAGPPPAVDTVGSRSATHPQLISHPLLSGPVGISCSWKHLKFCSGHTGTWTWVSATHGSQLRRSPERSPQRWEPPTLKGDSSSCPLPWPQPVTHSEYFCKWHKEDAQLRWKRASLTLGLGG